MRLALALGARHLGLTWPNPSVGAVVVDTSGTVPVIVAQASTQPGGRPHAERVALTEAGDRARGATLYVSLEPCSHHGRSPPCVDAILDSGIARLVSALEDPDPRVHGHGHTRLRDAGISVSVGCLENDARRLHRGHLMRSAEGAARGHREARANDARICGDAEWRTPDDYRRDRERAGPPYAGPCGCHHGGHRNGSGRRPEIGRSAARS